jgi:pilus assembly protein CpaB
MAIAFNKSWVVLGGAIVFGGIAVLASSRYISNTIDREKARLNPAVEQVDVVVAKSDLERGSFVGPESMAVRRMPREYVPGTAVLPDEFGNYEGAKLAVDLRAGEILLRGTLEGADTATFATRIARGVRAMTLRVDEVNSLSGLLQPGDHVDLFFTARPAVGINSGPRAKEQTALLLQNVEVLATGRQVRPTITDSGTPGTGRAFSTITVETSAKDAQRIILAEKAGAITAVLRGPDDRDPLVASTMDMSALFGVAPNARGKRTIARRGPTAEVIVGGNGRMARELVALGAGSGGSAIASAPSTGVPIASAVGTNPQASQMLRDLLDASRPPPEPLTMQSPSR